MTAPHLRPPDAGAPRAAGHDTEAQGSDTTSPDSAASLPLLKARAALRGIAVHEVADGWLIARWGKTVHAPSLATLRALLARQGVRP